VSEQICSTSSDFTLFRSTLSKDWFMRGSAATLSMVSRTTAVTLAVPPSRSCSEPGACRVAGVVVDVLTSTPFTALPAVPAAKHMLQKAAKNAAENAAAGRLRERAMTRTHRRWNEPASYPARNPTPLNDSHFTEFQRRFTQNASPLVAVKVKCMADCDVARKNNYWSARSMVSNSKRRNGRGRSQWRFIVGLSVLGLLIIASASHAGNRLLDTGGVMQLEGSAGGGLTPWALIAGLGTDRHTGASAFCTTVTPQEFQLSSCGFATGIHDRVELSFARQRFDLDKVIPDTAIYQTVVGAKVKLFGDAVFDQDR
jgi:hypothetical protein